MNLAAFGSSLLETVEGACVGFHFEEGGCWGMAQALAEHFLKRNKSAVVKYSPSGFVHTWVEVDGVSMDYRGEMSQVPVGAVSVELDVLPRIANDYGVDFQTFWGDAAFATELVKQAHEQTMTGYAESSLAA